MIRLYMAQALLDALTRNLSQMAERIGLETMFQKESTAQGMRKQALDACLSEGNVSQLTVYFCYPIAWDDVFDTGRVEHELSVAVSHAGDTVLNQQPIFLSEAEVRANCRRLNLTRYLVIKAVVPASAIVGQYRRLSIKPGRLSGENICGCYTRDRFVRNEQCVHHHVDRAASSR